MSFLLRIINEKILFPRRLNGLKKIIPLVGECRNFLDIGCSSGELSSELQKNIIGSNIVGIDTVIQKKNYIPVIKYDGKELPFPDNKFDCVLIVDVLHHDKDSERIIKEARRVTSDIILIKDHYYENIFDLMILKLADYIGNKPYGIALPYNFYNIKQWKKIFAKNNLKIVNMSKFRFNVFSPCKQVIFKLQKK